MAPFQSAPLRSVQTSGLTGERYGDGPFISADWILNSSGTPNTIGLAFTKVSDGNAEVGGSGVFVGILSQPKEYALASSGLAPSLDLADGDVGKMVTTGLMYVQLDNNSGQAAAGDVGTGIFFVDATGVISAGVAGGGETQIANATIYLEDVPDDGLAIVNFR